MQSQKSMMSLPSILIKFVTLNSLDMKRLQLFSFKYIQRNNFCSTPNYIDISKHINDLKNSGSLETINFARKKRKKRSKNVSKLSNNINKNENQYKLDNIVSEIKKYTNEYKYGRSVDNPGDFNEMTSFKNDNIEGKLSPELKDVLSKFTENSDDINVDSNDVPLVHDSRMNVNELLEHTNNNDDINDEDDSKYENEYNNININDKINDIDGYSDIFEFQKNNNNNDELIDNNDYIYEGKLREKFNENRKHFYRKNKDTKWIECGVSNILQNRLNEIGYKYPSIIQYLFIKNYHSYNKLNTFVIGSETGSGKTLAYSIPIIDEILEEYIDMGIIEFKDNSDINNININKDNIIINNNKRPWLYYPKTIIIEPNIELCTQVRGVISSICRPFHIYVDCWSEKHKAQNWSFIYNELINKNNPIEPSPEILICTPSVLKHIFNIKWCLRLSHIIFDEADQMLVHKNGKFNHIKYILDEILLYHKDKMYTKNESILRRFKPVTYIFAGATLANKRVKVYLGNKGARSRKQRNTPLPEKYMILFKKSKWIISPNQHRFSPNLKQKFIYIRDNEELQELLLRVLHRHPIQYARFKRENKDPPKIPQTIIFCNSKNSVKECSKFLEYNNINHVHIHEKMDDKLKDQNIKSFELKKMPILVATYVMYIYRYIIYSDKIRLY